MVRREIVTTTTYAIVHGIKVAQNFVPETFGRLTTIGPRFRLTGTGRRRVFFQVFVCSCGSYLVGRCSDTYSRESCGCVHRDRLVRQNTDNAKHGMSNSAEYRVWKSIKQRCGNKRMRRYADYGGRGIRVCDRWLEPETGFLNFLADMGERPSKGHSIDRCPDNNGDYCPDNCRWATMTTQSRNRRSNRLLTYNDKTQCVADWSIETGIHKDTIHYRLRAGWTTEKTLATPIRRKTKV